ncbi:MAG: transglycosylase domain-containing protein [Saprospiraceae bacterium]
MRQIIDFFLNGTDQTWHKRLVKWMWMGALAAILGIALLFFGLSFTKLPSVADLENPKSEEATLVLGSRGDVLGRLYVQNRVEIKYEDLSPILVQALVSTEDERYFKHTGIDFHALGRVAVKTVLLGQRSSGGASTITQQLAKLLFTGVKANSMPKRFVQKLKEWIIAVRLEKKYTKEEIIALYLNKFEFINGAYGIKAASEIYFGTTPDNLKTEEAAMLVGMLKNPSLFNPIQRADTALHRRMVVLKQMQKNNIISEATYDSLRVLPLGLNFSRQTHIDGLAPYFRMEVSKDVKTILERADIRKPDGSKYDLYRDGLRIHTTIDSAMQRIAEEEMIKNMSKVQKSFNSVWKGMNPWTYKSDSDHEIPLETRENTLNKLIRSSDRYQDLRKKHILPIITEIAKEVDLTFHEDDREVERVIAESKQSGVIANLVSRNLITTGLAAEHRKVMKSKHFAELKEKWALLQKETKEAFDKKVNMKVFAYNDKMETDTILSPLDSIKYLRMFLQTGILAIDPRNGHVKVWVGGINHKYFQFDHVRTRRQVGSTFKPFVYATAIQQQGFSPCQQVYDLPITIAPGDGQFYLSEPWTPQNSHGEYTGELFTLKQGLAKSKNTISAWLMKQLGSAQPVRELVHQMGIDKNAKYPNGQYILPAAPSIALGSADLTVMEMTGAYTTFANNGYFRKPIYILKIEDKNGKKIYEAYSNAEPALRQNHNYVMVEMLRYAGTGLQGVKSDVGGKTGTTNDYVDGWFMGITPNLVVGTWVGGEDRWFRFRSIHYGQGAYMAKPFFREFIKRLETTPGVDYDVTAKFYRPPGDLQIELNCNEYDGEILPIDGDQEFQDEIFNDGFGDEGFNKPPVPNKIKTDNNLK